MIYARMFDAFLRYRAVDIFWHEPISQGHNHGGLVKAVLAMEPGIEGEMPQEATFSLSHEQARNLLDALIKAGVRPTSYVDEASRIQPMQAHIDDLRTLLMHQMLGVVPEQRKTR